MKGSAVFLRSFLCLLCLLPSILHSKDLEIHVRAETSLLPVNISLLSSPKNTKQDAYLKSLRDLFARDLALGDLLAPTSEIAPLTIFIEACYPELIFSFKRDGKASQKIFSLELSGDPSKDHQTIHEAADRIHFLLTRIPGISSGKILFSLCSTDASSELKQGEIWSVDYDGQHLAPLTSEHSLSITPAWMHIGHIPAYIYVSYKLGVPKIFLNTLSQPAGKKILAMQGNQFMPVFSPKTKLLAFISDRDGNPDLFVQPFSLATGAIGTPKKLLNETFGTQGNPSFSPDGTRLVFVSNKDGTPRIYQMQISPEQHPPRLLTKKYRNSSCPTWSPDGKKIAFCSVIKGVRQICVYDLASGKDEQLTTSADHKESPSWAADSNHLVYSAGSAHTSELFLLSLITKKSKKIVIGSGEKRFPCWGAFPSQHIKKAS